MRPSLVTLGPTRVVGRLAPSPTGRLHLGHARSFMLSWWSARAAGGRIVLRVEDLDVSRVEQTWIDVTRRDLEWLGLDWDEEHLQSDALPRINAEVSRLLNAGAAYACTCSRGDIKRAQSAPHAEDHTEIYPGTCRGRYAGVAEAERRSGKAAGVRFQARAGITEFHDQLAGLQRQDVAEAVGDFLIAKRDGAPAYQIAVVVDDHAQGVTEVVRGDDLLSSTPRQLLLQQALGYDAPRYVHVPLVVDSAGRRLAKRHDSLSLAALQQRGIPAGRVAAWVANSAGLFSMRGGSPKHQPPSQLSPRELIPEFSWEKLQRAPVVVSEQTLQELGA